MTTPAQSSSTSSRDFTTYLSKFDVFPKFVDVDFYSRSFGGGVITLVTYAVAFFLLLAEINVYTKTHVKHDLTVDKGRGEHMRINLDVYFPELSCASLGLDVMDVSGEAHLDVVDHDMRKIRYDRYGVKMEKEEKHKPNEKIAKKAPPSGSPKKKTAEELVPEFMEDGKTPYCGSCYGADTGGANAEREAVLSDVRGGARRVH